MTLDNRLAMNFTIHPLAQKGKGCSAAESCDGRSVRLRLAENGYTFRCDILEIDVDDYMTPI